MPSALYFSLPNFSFQLYSQAAFPTSLRSYEGQAGQASNSIFQLSKFQLSALLPGSLPYFAEKLRRASRPMPSALYFSFPNFSFQLYSQAAFPTSLRSYEGQAGQASNSIFQLSKFQLSALLPGSLPYFALRDYGVTRRLPSLRSGSLRPRQLCGQN
jgi:hypothetical protein